ncbi:hypothetical protein Pla52o_56350 [Novipirellula galeiformis]|uniref:Uncharacterized protein n=1 Tax=Novipirellula galeiformis TaxID=2528004 RepID=A0A5C6BHM9_9BACT|nr:hypothetical protein Pla52o_56350 [Novipirellula galeiformis]
MSKPKLFTVCHPVGMTVAQTQNPTTSTFPQPTLTPSRSPPSSRSPKVKLLGEGGLELGCLMGFEPVFTHAHLDDDGDTHRHRRLHRLFDYRHHRFAFGFGHVEDDFVVHRQ